MLNVLIFFVSFGGSLSCLCSLKWLSYPFVGIHWQGKEMGAICCCPCVDEFEEYPNNSLYGHCICLRFFLYQLFTGCDAMFHRIEGRSTSSSVQGVVVSLSGIGPVQTDSSLNDSSHSVSRPMPYDADQGYTRLQRDGLVSRWEKSMTHLQEDLQPLRRNLSSYGLEPLGSGKKWSSIDSAEDLNPDHLESPEKMLVSKSANGLFYIQTSSEDEDVCPTCLDEYTPENPKIMTRCSHHFHLGCIYEWMERSDTCPICGKEMEFCESP